ncbi:MAG: HDOD domain-containing protein [Gemmatimonadota bacterium]
MPLDPQELLKNATNLASPPIIYQRLVAVINHPRSGAADVARVLSEDTGLTARLLRLVNSALFSFPQRIGTVTHAVRVVGTAQVRDLALATSIMTAFKNVPADLVDMDSFWRHSLACGIAARVLASHRREFNVERFFVAGMLHDLGRLVIFQEKGQEAREAIERAAASGDALHRTERDVLGFDHAQVGGALMSQWNFPGAFQEAVAFHHRPAQASRFPVETAVVHIADLMANALSFGSSGTHDVPELVASAWDTLGVDAAMVPTMLEEIERQFADAAHIQLGMAA